MVYFKLYCRQHHNYFVSFHLCAINVAANGADDDDDDDEDGDEDDVIEVSSL